MNRINAEDYQIMLSRMQALEQIALEASTELCAPLSEAICKQRLERAIEELAPGCSHTGAH